SIELTAPGFDESAGGARRRQIERERDTAQRGEHVRQHAEASRISLDPIEQECRIAHVPLVQIGQSANLALGVRTVDPAELTERIHAVNPLAEIGNWHARQCTMPEPGMPASVAFVQPTSIEQTIDALQT